MSTTKEAKMKSIPIFFDKKVGSSPRISSSFDNYADVVLPLVYFILLNYVYEQFYQEFYRPPSFRKD